jgi:FtsP/CotA-like multicopper oxidase with cupredoxin domain
MKKITILILFSILVLGCIQNQNKIQMQNTQTMILNSSEKIDIQTTKVQREINGKTVEMFAYNSQIPGPTIKVREGSKIKVNFTNNIVLF